jgi:hypothetical protein
MSFKMDMLQQMTCYNSKSIICNEWFCIIQVEQEEKIKSSRKNKSPTFLLHEMSVQQFVVRAGTSLPSSYLATIWGYTQTDP